ncbi:hypothetical protein ONZ43_g5601 [Nemania bipapillata]|uniref:Uncharacterized protein n=1 Tax=Nemania bipapillata TaxID=110536 RepID=A0ACC2I8K7_9PEZI|nr:hypothetical protein ONZ43_g5601 [Nemania bipapillata]
MLLYNMPDWLRILLVILTCASFAPQLYLLIARHGDASGLDLRYVLLNLAVATELFAISFLVIVNNIEPSDVFAHNPLRAGDWINLVNFGVIWVLWLVIFLIGVAYYSRENGRLVAVVVTAYISLLMISLVPVFADAIANGNAPAEPSNDRRWFGASSSGFIRST